MDVLPNPATRVEISEIPGDPASTYINANYIRSYTGQPRVYIAAMGCAFVDAEVMMQCVVVHDPRTSYTQ